MMGENEALRAPAEEAGGGRRAMSCGLELSSAADLHGGLVASTNAGYQFIVVPFVHPRYRRELVRGRAAVRQEPVTRSDLVLASQDWNRLVVGKLSEYLEVDSECESVRRQSEAALLQELELASHLSLPAVTLRLRPGNNLNLARILNSKMNGGCTYQVWVRVPLEAAGEAAGETADPWQWWNELRSQCDYDKRLCLALEVGPRLPEAARLERWLGEPVKCLLLPTAIFMTNQREFPVLSRAHQELVRRFMALDVQYVVRGKNRHADIAHYCSYVSFLGKKLHISTPFTEYIQGCEDYLQNPLQPLADNLETLVYEVFEKDPHKYNQYQEAIRQALCDRAEPDRPQVVMVLGAGRGPLVRAALNASELSGRAVRVLALEKNPHAVNTLRALARELWPGQVTVIAGDMRTFRPPDGQLADLLVSELLGSFADNELSPECLEGARALLRPDGVCIPQAYTSWLAPVQSLKLYNEIRATRPPDKTVLSCFETPYVVHLVNKYDIGPSQPLFTFSHGPAVDEATAVDGQENARYGRLRFESALDCVLTGMAGYFTCRLYGGVQLSTEPRSHTHGMMSWFPIFFPLHEPVQLVSGDVVEVAFWRRVSDSKVWYEWALASPRRSPIYNPNGRSYTINK